LKIKSIFRGSALLCTALLTAALVFSARPLAAETTSSTPQEIQKQSPISTNNPAVSIESPEAEGKVGTAGALGLTDQPFVVGPTKYVATAYSLRGRTASGLLVSKGVIAADPRILPLGSRVRLEAGTYSGEYLVADTGSMVKGRRIDIWTQSSREAMRFGRRTVKLTILSYGGKYKAAHARLKT
jgi:3D (Asp-Asp-Asp) domain-containing protein